MSVSKQHVSITNHRTTAQSARKRKRDNGSDGDEEIEVDKRPFTIKVGRSGGADMEDY